MANMRISTLVLAFFTAACGTALTSQAAQALEVSTACSTPQALSQALKDEGQTLIILGNQLVRKAGSPETADYAMRAVYLNPKTGQGYVVAGNVPFDPSGEKQQAVTCATIELKLENAHIYNQASMDVSPSALVTGNRAAALDGCARQPAKPHELCEFHNDTVTSFVQGGNGLMFQGTATASTSDAPVGSIVTLFGNRSGSFGAFTYTTADGTLRSGSYFPYVGYTEKGTALLGRRAPAEVASLN